MSRVRIDREMSAAKRWFNGSSSRCSGPVWTASGSLRSMPSSGSLTRMPRTGKRVGEHHKSQARQRQAGDGSKQHRCPQAGVGNYDAALVPLTQLQGAPVAAGHAAAARVQTAAPSARRQQRTARWPRRRRDRRPDWSAPSPARPRSAARRSRASTRTPPSRPMLASTLAAGLGPPQPPARTGTAWPSAEGRRAAGTSSRISGRAPTAVTTTPATLGCRVSATTSSRATRAAAVRPSQ
jgi:hypothetical protein